MKRHFSSRHFAPKFSSRHFAPPLEGGYLRYVVQQSGVVITCPSLVVPSFLGVISRHTTLSSRHCLPQQTKQQTHTTPTPQTRNQKISTAPPITISTDRVHIIKRAAAVCIVLCIRSVRGRCTEHVHARAFYFIRKILCCAYDFRDDTGEIRTESVVCRIF
jgi:hypothetical protein